MPHIKISTYNSANNYKNPIIFEDNISEEQSVKIHEFFKKIQIKKEERINKLKNQPMKNGTVVTPEFKIKYEIGDKNKKGENMYACSIIESKIVFHEKIATPLLFSVSSKPEETGIEIMNKMIKKAKTFIKIAVETSEEIESGKLKL